MKIICIHHRLADMGGHRFNEAVWLRQQARRRGHEFDLLVNSGADAAVLSALEPRGAMVDPTFCPDWSFDERSRRFVGQLRLWVSPVCGPDDCVMITVATQLETHALVQWLGELPRDKKPWICILMPSDRWNRHGKTEYDRQIAEFAVLREAMVRLSAKDAGRLIFFTHTPGLAQELNTLLGAPFTVVPMLHSFEARPKPELPASRGAPCIGLFGGARREKGSHLVPDVIRACKGRVEVDFLIQLFNEQLSPGEYERLSMAGSGENVKVIHGGIPEDRYAATMKSVDAVLLPYQSVPYTKRTSGVFSEAVAYGRVVIVSRGNWLARQVEAGRAAGVIFDRLEPECIADAIRQCVLDLDRLLPRARELSVAWKKEENITVFMDAVEKRIAERQDKSRQPS